MGIRMFRKGIYCCGMEIRTQFAGQKTRRITKTNILRCGQFPRNIANQRYQPKYITKIIFTMKNNGWDRLEYNFGDDPDLNSRMSDLINEFCHVFRCHADGHWKNEYKPEYVKLLAVEIREKPSLIAKLIKLKDPVVSNVTYAAIEFNNSEGDGNDV